MKQLIFSNWHFMRLLRLVLGLVIMVRSAMVKDWTIGALGILVAGMAVFNLGCCGPAGCSAPIKKTTKSSKETTYEEVV